MLRDELSQLSIENAIVPVVLAGNGTTTTGLSIDGANANVVQFVVTVGASGDTLSGSVLQTLILQDSDATGSGWAAVDNADFVIEGTNASFNATNGAFGVIDSNGDASKSYAIGYRGPKRYTRVLVVRTGNNVNGIPGGAVAIKYPRRIPAAS